QIDEGSCNPKSIITMTSSNNIRHANEMVIASLNSAENGVKEISGDVVSPYASFSKGYESPPAQEAAAAGSSESAESSSSGSGGRFMASSGSIQRASADFGMDARIPTLNPVSKEPQYYAMKKYIDT